MPSLGLDDYQLQPMQSLLLKNQSSYKSDDGQNDIIAKTINRELGTSIVGNNNNNNNNNNSSNNNNNNNNIHLSSNNNTSNNNNIASIGPGNTGTTYLPRHSLSMNNSFR